MRARPVRFVLIAAASLWVSGVQAQPVYKCTQAGKVTYSHEPCLDATVVDTTPTQGLDKSSGKSRKGADVRADETNRMWADALKPLLNETPAEREKRHRRSRLAPDARVECGRLDPEVARSASPASPSAEALLKARARYRELRC